MRSAALSGEVAQFVEIALRIRMGTARQVAQELQHLRGRGRHLGHERGLGEAGEAQQASFSWRGISSSCISGPLSQSGLSPSSLARVT